MLTMGVVLLLSSFVTFSLFFGIMVNLIAHSTFKSSHFLLSPLPLFSRVKATEELRKWKCHF